jgi:hypothetical protein
LIATIVHVLTALLAGLYLIVGAQPRGEGASVEARGVFHAVQVLLIRALALPLAGIEAVTIRPD